MLSFPKNSVKILQRIVLILLIAANFTITHAQANDEKSSESIVGVGSTIGQYWSSLIGGIADWLPSMPSTTSFTKPLRGARDSSEFDFKNMMSAAGFSLKSMKMGMSAYPKFDMSFGQKRELSEADKLHAYRILRKQERSLGGPLAAAQRLVVYTVLQLQEYPDYKVEKVDVSLLPFPSVDFYVYPTNDGLSAESSRIMQRIDDVYRKLEDMGN